MYDFVAKASDKLNSTNLLQIHNRFELKIIIEIDVAYCGYFCALGGLWSKLQYIHT